MGYPQFFHFWNGEEGIDRWGIRNSPKATILKKKELLARSPSETIHRITKKNPKSLHSSYGSSFKSSSLRKKSYHNNQNSWIHHLNSQHHKWQTNSSSTMPTKTEPTHYPNKNYTKQTKSTKPNWKFQKTETSIQLLKDLGRQKQPWKWCPHWEQDGSGSACSCRSCPQDWPHSPFLNPPTTIYVKMWMQNPTN